MPTLNRKIVFTLICLLVPFAVSAEDKYRIGVIFPLSGDGAGLGKFAKNGAELAHQSLSPEDQSKVELIFEDDAWQKPKSVSAFHKLVDSNKIDAVLVAGSGIGHAVVPLAEAKQKILIAVAASDKKVVFNRKYAFTHWVSPESESRALVAEIKRRGLKKLAIVTSEHEGTIAVENSLLEELKKQEMQEIINLNERFLVETRDFRSFVTKARARNIDGFCTILISGSLSSFVKQVTASGSKADIFGYELFEDELEVKASGGTMIGKWYVNAEDGVPTFQELYKSRYKETPTAFVANSFDSIRLLVEGYKKYGKDNEKIANYLRTLKDYNGAAGTYSATGDNRFDLPVALKIVTAEGFKKLP